MGLLSKKDSKLILDPLADNNPITIQVLGICSALAITAQLKASVVMALSVLAVLSIGNVVISLMRNVIPPKIRIIVQLVVVAALVIIVDLVLKAFSYQLSKQLSVFVGQGGVAWKRAVRSSRSNACKGSSSGCVHTAPI